MIAAEYGERTTSFVSGITDRARGEVVRPGFKQPSPGQSAGSSKRNMIAKRREARPSARKFILRG